MWMIQRDRTRSTSDRKSKIVLEALYPFLQNTGQKYKWVKQESVTPSSIINYRSIMETTLAKLTILACFSIDLQMNRISVSGVALWQGDPLIIPSISLRVAFLRELLRLYERQKGKQYIKCSIYSGIVSLSSVYSYSEMCFDSPTFIRQEIKNSLIKVLENGAKTLKDVLCKLGILFQEIEDPEITALRETLKKHISLSSYDIGISEKDNQSSFPSDKKLQKRIQTIKKFLVTKENSDELGPEIDFYSFTRRNISNRDASWRQENLVGVQLQNQVKNYKPRSNIPGQNYYLFNEIKNVKQSQKQHMFYRTSKCTLSIINVTFDYEYVKDTLTDKQPAKTSKPMQKLMLAKTQVDKGQTSSKIVHERNIVKLLNTSSSPFFLKYYECIDQESHLKDSLLMDYFPNSINFGSFLQNRKNSLSSESKLVFLSNIANALRFLGYFKIAHLDLNLNNVIIFEGCFTQIIDFGESYNKQVVGDDKFLPGFTLPFCPPEVFTQSSFTSQDDSFSLGIILYRLLLHTFPFFPSDKLKFHYRQRNYHDYWFQVPEKYRDYGNENTYQLAMLLFNKSFGVKPEDRPLPVWSSICFRQIKGLY